MNPNYLEPVGSVAPRIAALEKFRVVYMEESSVMTLFCPAQSYPVPAFRYMVFVVGSNLEHLGNSTIVCKFSEALKK